MPSDNNDTNSATPPPSAGKGSDDSRQFANAMELPIIIVAAIGIGGLIGYGLDHWLHTKPIFMLIFGAVGFFAGVREVLRRLPA
jgi:F0F1-type ATP synthase assembly protein I